MKAAMIRKASSAKDWLDWAARMEYDGETVKKVDVAIEKTITLPKEEFKKFADNLLDDSEIVKENIDLMRVDENGVWHCIKVTSRGHTVQHTGRKRRLRLRKVYGNYRKIKNRHRHKIGGINPPIFL